jgi:hypothetical protein
LQNIVVAIVAIFNRTIAVLFLRQMKKSGKSNAENIVIGTYLGMYRKGE